MESRPRPKIAILGIGVIGGSIGMALRRNDIAESVVGWDPSDSVRQLSTARNAVDYLANSAESAVRDADLVFLAPPIESILPLLHTIKASIVETAVVTDVGSAKARIVSEAEVLLGERFVGGHPMAGHEKSGIAFASPSLFEGAAWALTPTENTSPESLKLVATIVTAIGAQPRICPPETHDLVIAYTSHLPHILAFGLADSAASVVPAELNDLIAGSFRDGSRVALSDPHRWVEILRENRNCTIQALDVFIAWAEEARSSLAANDRADLSVILSSAHEARLRFPN